MGSRGPTGSTLTWAELWAIPRVPGDDDTDHILRHAHGIDPDAYRGGVMETRDGWVSLRTGERVPAPENLPARRTAKRDRTAKRARTAKGPVRPSAPRAAATAVQSPGLALSPLVRLALRTAPDLERKIARLVEQHLSGTLAPARARLVGLPVTLTTRGSTTTVRFASEG